MQLRNVPWVLALGLLAPDPRAQIFVPARTGAVHTELNSRTNYPLMRSSSRSQFVIGAAEIGTGAAMWNRLELRFDGPTLGTAGGTVQDLRVFLAAAATEPASSSQVFAANVQGAPTLVFQAANHAFGPDGNVNPDPFGGPNGELRFVFAAPFAYQGGALVVEIRARGNSNQGAGVANCHLDAEEEPGVGASLGSQSPLGTGCGTATLGLLGQIAPGGTIAAFGQGYGQGLPVGVYLGGSRTLWGSIPLPLDLGPIGAQGCLVYSDLSIGLTGNADAAGRVNAFDPVFAVPVPSAPALQGAVVQFQAVGFKPGANALGLVTSNNVGATLGAWKAPTRGFVAHYHHLDADAPVAAWSAPMVPAMRFQ
ncbi:MAG: hypothetical protein IT458_12455 [Planctomycetes bacterium]|nr:hypothetical protein [Planctomycetota bacterium]